ncbi:ABC transporter substrate-binding protein [Marmoricola endophyticus]|uniref:ABC transporter substrate-binding protein n=1 Tax=Marmoricola endophyticus TaxID=2040280 RepID=A0A917BGY5_9ACTN|nr:MlaD family protein [Marmoricola endophyticus]GGF43345.1 ABC transporter substrate-binding protein [Marmoricola endophyticus]
MKLLDKKTAGDTTRLVVFMVVTALATGLLVVVIGNFTFGSKTTYKAIFSDSTGLVKGDDVRIAGVRVGKVKGIEVHDRNQSEVTFDVLKTSTVTRSSEAVIKYRNLVGQRYISLSEGVGDTGRQPTDQTIPMSRTKPALDLTVLFNGFKPLFAALTPADINKLSYEVIQVFQGEGDTVSQLLASTASVTQTLASRDKVIGELITNLNDVLTTVANRDGELTSLILRLKEFIGGLKDDRQAILGSLDGISSLAVQTSDLVTDVRPGLVQDIKQLRRVTGNINAQGASVDKQLQILPIKLRKIGRTAIYGSFFNFYLCQLSGSVKLVDGLPDLKIPFPGGGQRCNASVLTGGNAERTAN